MKKGYSVDNMYPSRRTKFIYLFNYDILNEVAHICFRRDFKERYGNRKECVGVWKIKNKN